MADTRLYLFHGLTTLCFDWINKLLIMVCMMIPLCAFFSFSNVYCDASTYGLEAIQVRHQWYQKYQGKLDEDHLLHIFQSTYVDEYDCSLMALIDQIKNGQIKANVPLTKMSILSNVISPMKYSIVLDLCHQFFDENLDYIEIDHGYTIPDSEGLYTLCSDLLSILILQALLVLLIITRSVDHIVMNRFVLLERSYSNTRRLYGSYYLLIMGFITLCYGYTILVLLGLYDWAFEGLGGCGSFALWSNTMQSAFDGLTIGQYFLFLVLSYYLLFLVVTNLYIYLAMKMNGLFAWILASGMMLIVFAMLSNAAYIGPIGCGMGLFILHNSYTFYAFNLGFTIALQLIQFIFWYAMGIYWLNHCFLRIK